MSDDKEEFWKALSQCDHNCTIRLMLALVHIGKKQKPFQMQTFVIKCIKCGEKHEMDDKQRSFESRRQYKKYQKKICRLAREEIERHNRYWK